MRAAYAVAGMFFIGFEMAKDKPFSKAHALMLAATLDRHGLCQHRLRVGLIRVSSLDRFARRPPAHDEVTRDADAGFALLSIGTR
jgi:hypothetical protein